MDSEAIYFIVRSTLNSYVEFQFQDEIRAPNHFDSASNLNPVRHFALGGISNSPFPKLFPNKTAPVLTACEQIEITKRLNKQ